MNDWIRSVVPHVYLALFIPIVACSPIGNPEDQAANDKWWTEDNRQFVISELNRTTNELREEIENLSDDQWHFREQSARWSIAEIVEHLEMQNQLHYREISVVSNAPQYLEFRSITKGNDHHFIKYGTDTTRGQSQWFLEPLGRFCSKDEGEKAFFRARRKLKEFVEQTEVDLRKQFTFRTSVENKQVPELKIGQVRDLHQLLLTGIAHSDRHLHQIRKIKQHSGYPIPH